MGRYLAPQFDHEDDGQATPMDWTAIPDDDDQNHDASDYRGSYLNGRSESLVCRVGERCDRVRCSKDVEYDDNCNDAPAAMSGEGLSREADHYTEQTMNDRLVLQQNMLEEKSSRIRTLTIFAVAIVAIVLKRYAPPPPPLLNRVPLPVASLAPNYHSNNYFGEEDARRDATNQMLNEQFTHHQTWASYSRHILFLVHEAFTYGTSVAWYAVSNAFSYALEEVSHGIETFSHGGGESGYDESLWSNWKAKLISIGTSLLRRKEPDDETFMSDAQHHYPDGGIARRTECPIRIPAASNLHTHLPRGATAHDTVVGTESTTEGWSTEDYLRQTIGSSLSPQNLALKIIAEGLDSWGEGLVGGAPVSLVHKMATAVSVQPNDRYLDETTLSHWILPAAMGFLLVGPEGVGKLHVARRMARLLLGHCDEAPNWSELLKKELEGLLEVSPADYSGSIEGQGQLSEMIINHINSREGLGSAIIIHHIETAPMSTLSEIANVISGKSDTLTHHIAPDKQIKASCNGTVFILTSKQWGTKSIFRNIQQNNGLKGLRRDSLISSISWEVDSHLDYWSKLAQHSIIAPILPFQQEDLSSIMQGRIQMLNRMNQNHHWKRLEVSLATIRYFVGADHVEYFDLGEPDEGDGASTWLTFATGGAHALDNNALWQTLRTRLATGTRRRPGLTLRVGLDDGSTETTFSWCKLENGEESCELEWRSLLV